VKFTLKDYQADAVEDVLANLKRARDNFKNPDKRELSSFALAATTGAGKTVMAAAAIEALFWGSDTFDFEPDPGAVVLWFSDDPSLNKQTLNRLRQASEKFTYTNLVQIEPPFAKPRLEPGKVYFLNTQKLAERSLLTRGSPRDARRPREPAGPGARPRPTCRGGPSGRHSPTPSRPPTSPSTSSWTRLTAASAPRRPRRSRPSCAARQRHHRARPAIPIVWGISATPKHFRDGDAAGGGDH
jgi:type III restriction enzyme